MPPLEELDLIDRAVLWVRISLDRNNEPVLDSPVEIPVRWVDDQRVITGPEGIPIEITARIATNRRIETRSILWYGCADEWGDTSSPELYTVEGTSRAKSIDGRNIRHEYMLAKFKGTLPQGTEEP